MVVGSKLNVWNKSRRVGERVEDIVREALNAVGHSLNKNNDEVKTEVDLASANNARVEVKCAFTPYPSSPTPAKLSSKEHLTLDVANIDKYDDDVFIVFAIHYPETKGIYAIEVRKCKEIIRDNPRRVYLRSARTGKDKLKKVGISLAECFEVKVPRKFLTRIAKVATSAEH